MKRILLIKLIILTINKLTSKISTKLPININGYNLRNQKNENS